MRYHPSISSRYAAWAAIAIVFVAASAGMWHLLHPSLPFTGPYSGLVIDAGTGLPLQGALISAAWTCHDSPWPDGSGHRFIKATARTDPRGAFALTPPRERGGLSQTDFALTVSAPGYIDACFIVDPNSTPLPASTAAWPFVVTTVQTSLPASMTIRLNPARPVLMQALNSPDPLVRQTAQEKLAGQ